MKRVLEHEHYQTLGPKKLWLTPSAELVATEALKPTAVPVVLDIRPGPVDLVIGDDSHPGMISGSTLSLLPSTYDVSASKGSYKPFKGKLEVKAGPGFRYPITLAANMAPVLVKLKQSPANVVIAGKSFPAVKDGTIVQAPVGLTEVKVSKNGYKDFSTRLDVKSGQTSELTVAMVPKSVNLLVSSNVDVPKVFVIAAGDTKKRWGEKKPALMTAEKRPMNRQRRIVRESRSCVVHHLLTSWSNRCLRKWVLTQRTSHRWSALPSFRRATVAS